MLRRKSKPAYSIEPYVFGKKVSLNAEKPGFTQNA